MSDKKIGLSRRRVLGGLGAIGVASAGAGLGTSAYFSDTESFVGNILEAGSLDLYVHVDYEEDQGSYGDYEIDGVIQGDTFGEDPDGEALTIDVDDLKPGDSGEGELCFSIVDNPAWMWMCGELTANDENSVTEPEADADGEDNDYDPDGDIDGEGELADAMMVSLTYCDEDGDPILDDDEEPIVILEGTLGEVMSQLDNGVALDGDLEEDDRSPFPGVESSNETAGPCVCVEWWVPTDVGNEIQTDSVEFDFSFVAVQSRHNDGDVNPCITSTSGEDWGKFQFGDEAETWFGRLKAGDGPGGGAAQGELYIGNNAAGGDYNQDQYDWPDTFEGSFSVEYDSDANEGTITLYDSGGSSLSSATYTGLDDQASTGDGSADELGITAKANTAGSSVDVSNVMLNGTSPSGATSVSASGDGTSPTHLHITDVDTTVDWTLTGDVNIEFAGATGENVAMDVHVD
ncbi:choice-of-anchor W domain-containing protein [Haloarchaeobius salinus]|uniref:choice-of-anchor W domain-containing protein n=1 Tax=Haloarchaeobius salinus TaxID=1198298 RepID=UPI00210CECDB|nr:choice-of-anchor W domain-containing protein [Haloarchaeobius salinus]